MGILNITPDSFSDGGLWLDPDAAARHAEQLVGEGADLLDIGAESTRPGGGVYGDGAQPVPAQEELRRLLPALEMIRDRVAVPISVDTRKGTVARAALEAGADLINDISALTDPELGAAVAASGCPLVLMHSRGSLRSMQRDPHFDDLLAEVRSELAEAMKRATLIGIREEQLIIDPGIGFGKNRDQNLSLLRHLHALRALGRPLLVGASRKSFIGEVSGGAPPAARLPGSLAAVSWAASMGASIVRVHDVAATVQFLRVWEAIDRVSRGAP